MSIHKCTKTGKTGRESSDIIKLLSVNTILTPVTLDCIQMMMKVAVIL